MIATARLGKRLKNAMNIKINVKSCITTILFITILSGTLIDIFHFPSFLMYFNDALLIIALIVGFNRLSLSIKRQPIIISLGIAVYAFICFISASISLVDPVLVLWAIRNTFRGILFFELLIAFLDRNDLERLFNIFLFFQCISLVLSLCQVFVFDLPQDKLIQDSVGGIFGYGNGAGTNTFGIICSSYFLISFIMTGHGGKKAIIACVSSLIIAALAEEKVFFIYFLILLVSILLYPKIHLLKKTYVIIISIIGMIISLNVLGTLYPSMLEVMTDLDKILSYSSVTYKGGYMLPRIGSFSIIENLFFDGEKQLLFGIGFGASETSSFFQSDFYREFGYYNYRWFTHQWTFIETGFLGFISYLGIFIAILFTNFKILRNGSKGTSIFTLTSIACSICMIISIWINATLKVDMCYLAFFSMALGLIANSNKSLKNC